MPYLFKYITLDAPGWVISDVSLGSQGVLGLAISDRPRPCDPVGLGLTPVTPIPAANF